MKTTLMVLLLQLLFQVEEDKDDPVGAALVIDAHLLFQVEKENEDDPDGAAAVIDAHLLFQDEEEDEDDPDGAAVK
jgi:hypothetical protein